MSYSVMRLGTQQTFLTSFYAYVQKCTQVLFNNYFIYIFFII